MRQQTVVDPESCSLLDMILKCQLIDILYMFPFMISVKNVLSLSTSILKIMIIKYICFLRLSAL